MALRISEFDAVTFDIYGTLIDWEPTIVEAKPDLTVNNLSELWLSL